MANTVTAASVAANVRAELARAGISARQLAEALGENRGWAHRRLALRAPKPFEIDELGRVAAHLNVPLARLIEPVDSTGPDAPSPTSCRPHLPSVRPPT